MSIVSNNIKYLRRQNGFTQDTFSEKIGIKRSLLGAYEEARAKPNYENLFLIAKEFNITVETLLHQDLLENSFKNNNFNARKNEILKNESNLISKTNSIENKIPLSNFIKSISEIDSASIVEPFIEKKELPIESFNREMQLAVGVPYIENNEILNYLHNLDSTKYLNTLPKISIPNFSGLTFRSFATSFDFPIQNSVFVGELIDFQHIVNGNHYFVLLHSGEMMYRRIFDLTIQKGVFLLSSDKIDISSTEIPTKNVAQIFKLAAFINYNEPLIYAQSNKVMALLEELNKEIRKN